jgi:tRNA (guanine37-N1)-methyltransferase
MTKLSFHLITIFPKIFESFLSQSILSKAVNQGVVSFNIIDPRDFAEEPHRKVDDHPYGGGPGMVMMIEPLAGAIRACKKISPDAFTILLSPKGECFKQTHAHQLSTLNRDIILISGRYEGIDARVSQLFVDQELSIGDFIIMGGEVASMTVIEATLRLVPGVLGNQLSIENESFSKEQILEYPQYTRPPLFEDCAVPEVLLSGNHAKITKWRKENSLNKTTKKNDKPPQ